MKKGTMWDKIKNEAVKAAVFCSAFFGNGTASSTNLASPPPSDHDTTRKEIVTDTTTKRTTDSIHKSFDIEEEVVKQLIASGQDVIGNFNLEGREFSPEELQMIKQCEQSLGVMQTAKKKSKTGRPTPGQQTYCLGAVKEIYALNGIYIAADRFAYRAVTGLQQNDEFVELNVPICNFRYMPDISIMAWEKGTTRYGHVAIKIGEKEYCDYVYNLRKNNRRGSSGQRYGKCHVFVLGKMGLGEDLLRTLVKEGRLKDEVKQKMLAKVGIFDMRYKLDMKNLMVKSLELADSSLRKQVPKKIAIKPFDSNEAEKLQAMKRRKFRDR